MIDVATIRRTAGVMGHEAFKGPDDTCPACGLNIDDMLKLRRVPHCDPGRWFARASLNVSNLRRARSSKLRIS